MTLTGDDIALALSSVQIATAFWKKKPRPRSNFVKEELAKLDALNRKLSAISDYAYPYECSDDMGIMVGAEAIMVTDDAVIQKTRADAAASAS